MADMKEGEPAMLEFRERLASGDISLAQAREEIAGMPLQLSAGDAAALYAGFRAWTWKALDQKRRDDELPRWADLIRRACLRVGSRGGRDKQLETLAELIAESVAIAVRLPIAAVLAKRHCREVLSLLRDCAEQTASKKLVMQQLGLSSSNLCRIMNLLTPAGLVEVEKHGRETQYVLSRRGAAEAAQMKPKTGKADLPLRQLSTDIFSYREALIEFGDNESFFEPIFAEAVGLSPKLPSPLSPPRVIEFVFAPQFSDVGPQQKHRLTYELPTDAEWSRVSTPSPSSTLYA